ncbi:unnamed protein product [Lathyrus sativus]|nr:unnamed protein product [Lathyrus sativus]
MVLKALLMEIPIFISQPLSISSINFHFLVKLLTSLSFFDRIISAYEITKLFPNLFKQLSTVLVLSGSGTVLPNQKLKIGVVLSGGQALGGHNVIYGNFDYLQERAKGSICMVLGVVIQAS